MNWKKFRENAKEWNNRSMKDYLFPNYIFNKTLFIVMMIAVAVLGLLIMINHDFDFSQKFYYHCPIKEGVCENPFVSKNFQTSIECPISDEAFCNAPYFVGGFTYGEPVSRDIKNYPLEVFLIVVLAFLLNHLLFNWSRKK